jgi:hypothetical protein
MAARLMRAVLSGAVFFVAFWAVYAVWEGPDHGHTDRALTGAVVVTGLVFLRTYMVEHLERRYASAQRPTFRTIVGAINTIIRKPKS